ncbi:hypothetical protein RchiOBHm_Chr6g0257561 [Rosa chinensis]|uniref:Uncharacterized protein n=1 Tax=Rosa chinensis TaxID=74649 RepID=A0A2P6PMG5_ROSCH|nr:hypothetical protein RchiOBHm_Chr6g0257561 [Rosa chinensis]
MLTRLLVVFAYFIIILMVGYSSWSRSGVKIKSSNTVLETRRGLAFCTVFPTFHFSFDTLWM